MIEACFRPDDGNNVIDVNTKEQEFLSNESIEGTSLAERLQQGTLPPEEALRYAIEIGSTLNRAHRRGMVHGKLSPHSVLLTETGARIVRPVEGTDLDALPYRAPEQVSGKAPDWRSDIFSFGALLYEMVSGRRAFSGEAAGLDRAILEKPPATLMGKSPIHAAMEGVIASCLEKDPSRRRQRIQNAVIELRMARPSVNRLSAAEVRGFRPPAPGTEVEFIPGEPSDIRPKRPRIFTPVQFPDEIIATPVSRGRQRMLLWMASIFGILLAVSGAWIFWQYQHPAAPPVYKFPVAPPDNIAYRMPVVSPDGKFFVMQSAGPEGKPMLWLRKLDQLQPTPIPQTENGFAPFWSPDSQYIAFFADNSLKRVRLTGGLVEKICDTEAIPGGGTWNRGGIIVFAPSQGGTLYQVSANGGKPKPLLTLNRAKFEHAHLWPQFLPDGNHFLFFVLSDLPGSTGVYTGSLGSPNHQLLFPSTTNAVYAPPVGSEIGRHGYLLYIRDRSLVGIPFNEGKLQTIGEPIDLQDDVGALESLSLAPVSVSANGTLVFQNVSPASRYLSWIDRSGKMVGSKTEGGSWGPPRISPDGRRALVAKKGTDQKFADLWMIDESGNATQFTTGRAHKGSPVWSPDGSRVAYFSNIDDNFDIVVSPANNGSRVEPIYKSAEAKYPTDWSRDGKFLFFGVLKPPEGESDIWGLSMTDHHAGPILDTIYSESYAALSPNGRWLAFQSMEAERNQVHVQPFDGITRGTKRRYDVSTETGGGLPRWRADGKELFYMTNDGRMMSVAVHPEAEQFEMEAPKLLFQSRPIPNQWNLYDVSPDGQRFLMNLPLEWSHSSSITVMTNWAEKVKDQKKAR